MEKFIEKAHHIEVQIFGDGAGQVVHLGERECSIQRRHQKVLEETPSPLLGDADREALAAAAVRLGQAAKYRWGGCRCRSSRGSACDACIAAGDHDDHRHF